MTTINKQDYNGGYSVSPHLMGGASAYSGTYGASSPQGINVTLEKGYIWSHVELYLSGHAGSAYVSATAVLKDGTTKLIYSKSGKSVWIQSFYISNYLTSAQIAQLDHIYVYASASGYSDKCDKLGGDRVCVTGDANVYGVALPWINAN